MCCCVFLCMVDLRHVFHHFSAVLFLGLVVVVQTQLFSTALLGSLNVSLFISDYVSFIYTISCHN